MYEFKQKIYTFFMAVLAVLAIVVFTQTPVSASPLIIGSSPHFDESVRLPILMYHEITERGKMSNRWTITPEEFEADLIYIKENGYKPVVMSDLIKFVNRRGKLPKKPIVLTFDDGLAGVYEYAYPLLKKYNMNAVLSVIGITTDEYSKGGPDDTNHYPHVSWTQVNEMVDSGHIELQNHSYDMHRSIGAKKRSGEALSDYKERLSKDLIGMQSKISEMTEQKATTFVYPFGAVSKESKDILRDIGFSASLGCYDIVNKLMPGQPECLFDLGRTLRPPGCSSEKVFKKFAAAEATANESDGL